MDQIAEIFNAVGSSRKQSVNASILRRVLFLPEEVLDDLYGKGYLNNNIVHCRQRESGRIIFLIHNGENLQYMIMNMHP